MSDFSMYRKVFLGECHGVGLIERGHGDEHVCIQILTEDDENWFTSESPFSSYWLPGLQIVLQEARDWMRANCDLDPSGCGWTFRP